MDIISNSNDIKNINFLLQKMALIYNALEDGWTVKKKKINIFLLKIIKVKKKYI